MLPLSKIEKVKVHESLTKLDMLVDNIQEFLNYGDYPENIEIYIENEAIFVKPKKKVADDEFIEYDFCPSEIEVALIKHNNDLPIIEYEPLENNILNFPKN